MTMSIINLQENFIAFYKRRGFVETDIAKPSLHSRRSTQRPYGIL
jgi:hypothetical protein